MWADLKKRISVGLGTATETTESSTKNTSNIITDEHKTTEEDDVSTAPYINSSQWYNSDGYKSLFSSKTSPKWITEDIARYLDSNYNKYDDHNLAQLISNQPDAHPFSDVVQDALNIFNEWRKWQNSNKNSGKMNEWKLSSSQTVALDSYTDTQLSCYWNTISDSSISATKGEMIVPYAVPVVCGVIENSEHECKYEEHSDTIHEIEALSEFCQLLYAQTSTPMFMTKRDIFGIGFNYVLPNAEIIMGCRSIHESDKRLRKYDSIIEQKWRQNKQYIRAFYTLDLYHLRPWYERNSNYTVVSYYSHLDLSGSIPNWVVNGMITDTPKIILSLKKYMDENVKLLSKAGQIHIPLKMLEFVGIYPDNKLYKSTKHKEEVGDDDKKLQYAFDDEELSDIEQPKLENLNSVSSEKDKLEKDEFVDVMTKTDSKRFLPKEKYDELETPIPTPDLEKAEQDQDERGAESDLENDDDEDEDEDEKDLLKDVDSEFEDNQYDEFVDVTTKVKEKEDEAEDMKTDEVDATSVEKVQNDEQKVKDGNNEDADKEKGDNDEQKAKDI